MKKSGKIVKILAALVILLIFIASLAAVSIAINQKNNGYSGLFGYTFAVVASNSMSGTIEINDMAVGRVVKDCSQIKIGDVITYKGIIGSQRVLITHRVTDIITDDAGALWFQTWGDNRTYDFEGETGVCYTADEGYRSESEIVSVYVGKIEKIGVLIDFIRSKAGLACMAIPIALLAIYEAISFFRIVEKNRKHMYEEEMKFKNDKLKEEFNTRLEDERKRIREELQRELAEQSSNVT